MHELSSIRSSHHGRSATSCSTTPPQVLTGSLGVGGSITDAHEDPERHGMVRRHAAIREQLRFGIHRQSVSSSRSTSPHVQTGSLGVGGSITDAHEDPEWHGMVRYAAVWVQTNRPQHSCHRRSRQPTTPDQPTNGPTHIGTRPINHTRPTYTGMRTSRLVTACVTLVLRAPRWRYIPSRCG